MSPIKPVDADVDNVTKVNAASKGVSRRVLSERVLASRSLARSVLGDDYQTLRLVCKDLPPTGRIPRSQILQASYRKIQTLEEEVRRLQARLGESPSSVGTGRRTDHLPCSIPGLCGFHLDQGRLLQSAQPRGGTPPEVQVLWQGSQTSHSPPRRPGPRPYQVRRPYLASSPPLQTRRWMSHSLREQYGDHITRQSVPSHRLPRSQAWLQN